MECKVNLKLGEHKKMYVSRGTAKIANSIDISF